MCDRYAKRGVAVHDGDADLDLRDLSVKVPRHEALPQQFHTSASIARQGYAKHDPERVGLDAASVVVSAPVSPDRATQVFEARRASLHAMAPAVVGFHGFAFLRSGTKA